MVRFARIARTVHCRRRSGSSRSLAGRRPTDMAGGDAEPYCRRRDFDCAVGDWGYMAKSARSWRGRSGRTFRSRPRAAAERSRESGSHRAARGTAPERAEAARRRTRSTVAQRTAELAAANAELQLQVGVLQHIPVAAWTLRPDGDTGFRESGLARIHRPDQRLSFGSQPEAWMTSAPS